MARNAVKIPITAQDKTGAAFNSVNSRMSRLKAASGAVTAALGPMIAAVGVVGFVMMGKRALDAADDIQKLSRRLEISTEALSQYRHVAALSGTDFQTLAKGLQYMQKNLSDASDGLTTAQRAFEDAGMSVSRLRSMKPEDAFEALGEAIAKIEDPARRTQVAMNVFGRAGVALIPIFDDGAGAVRAMREEADKLGLTLTQEMADRAADAKDALQRVNAVTSGLAQTLAIELAPALETAADELSDFIVLAMKVPNLIDKMKGGVAPDYWDDDNSKKLKETAAGARLLKAEITKLYEDDPSGFYPDIVSQAAANVIAGEDAATRLAAANVLFSDSLNAIPDVSSYYQFGSVDEAVSGMTDLQAAAHALGIELTVLATSDYGREISEDKGVNALKKEITAARIEARILAEELEYAYSLDISPVNNQTLKITTIGGAEDDWMMAEMERVENMLGAQGRVSAAAGVMADDIGGYAAQGAGQMVDAIGAAVFQSADLLESLGRIAQSIFGSIFSGFLRLGVGTLIGGPVGGVIAGTLATGGPVSANKAYIVGEEGPELFVPSTGGQIIPNGGAAAVVGQQTPAGNTYSVTVISEGLTLDDPLILRRVAESMMGELATLETHHGPVEAA